MLNKIWSGCDPHVSRHSNSLIYAIVLYLFVVRVRVQRLLELSDRRFVEFLRVQRVIDAVDETFHVIEKSLCVRHDIHMLHALADGVEVRVVERLFQVKIVLSVRERECHHLADFFEQTLNERLIDRVRRFFIDDTWLQVVIFLGFGGVKGAREIDQQIFFQKIVPIIIRIFVVSKDQVEIINDQSPILTINRALYSLYIYVPVGLFQRQPQNFHFLAQFEAQIVLDDTCQHFNQHNSFELGIFRVLPQQPDISAINSDAVNRLGQSELGQPALVTCIGH